MPDRAFQLDGLLAPREFHAAIQGETDIGIVDAHTPLGHASGESGIERYVAISVSVVVEPLHVALEFEMLCLDVAAAKDISGKSAKMLVAKDLSQVERVGRDVSANSRPLLVEVEHGRSGARAQLSLGVKVLSLARRRAIEGDVAQSRHGIRNLASKIFHDIGVGIELPHVGMPSHGLACREPPHGGETEVGRLVEIMESGIARHGDVELA